MLLSTYLLAVCRAAGTGRCEQLALWINVAFSVWHHGAIELVPHIAADFMFATC